MSVRRTSYISASSDIKRQEHLRINRQCKSLFEFRCMMFERYIILISFDLSNGALT